MSAKSGIENWPLYRGWPLNTGPLYTGSTVICKFLGDFWEEIVFLKALVNLEKQEILKI